jgi:prepilin-type processing-associated H-X9-DG protein/prepilin-type N-terminal cleavage/methylation domain-containing protein
MALPGHNGTGGAANRRAAARPGSGDVFPGPSGRSGFTLIELLVVIAMLGLLSALVATGARSALARAATVDCLSDLRQVGIAVQLYVNDNRDRLPGTSHHVSWTNSLAGYLGEGFIGRCPSVPRHRARITYGWNDLLASSSGEGLSIHASTTPSFTMVIAELATNQSSEHFHFAGVRGGAGRLTPNQFRSAVNVEVHNGGANYLFVDGHVETLPWAEVQQRLAQPNSTFILP